MSAFLQETLSGVRFRLDLGHIQTLKSNSKLLPFAVGKDGGLKRRLGVGSNSRLIHPFSYRFSERTDRSR